MISMIRKKRSKQAFLDVLSDIGTERLVHTENNNDN
jgi:hypothetical protein